jgi:hypothetical protein
MDQQRKAELPPMRDRQRKTNGRALVAETQKCWSDYGAAGVTMAPLLSQISQNSQAFYRFYLLRADDHIAARREGYFVNDAAAIAAAPSVIEDYPGVEIWCGQRRVATLSGGELARQQPPVLPRKVASVPTLVSRNKRLLQQAVATSSRTQMLLAKPMTWQHRWARTWLGPRDRRPGTGGATVFDPRGMRRAAVEL